MSANQQLAWNSVAKANLREVQFAELPKDWVSRDQAEREFRYEWAKREGLSFQIPFEKVAARDPEREFQLEWRTRRLTYIDALERQYLDNRNLRRAEMLAAFSPGVLLRRAKLEGAQLLLSSFESANFNGARLGGTDLREAKLEGAKFRNAKLNNADLGRANLKGADFSGARLEGANLSFARLEGANLSGARLEGANLGFARLEGANLSGARLEGANLSGARLEGANLGFARLEGANLRFARLDGANLFGARLEGTDLRFARLFGSSASLSLDHTSLSGANFSRSLLRDVDFGGTNMLELKEFSSSFGDRSVKTPPGFKRPDHWCGVVLSDADYFGRLRTWLGPSARFTLTSEELDRYPAIPAGTPCPTEDAVPGR